MFLIRNWKSGASALFCAATLSALGGGCSTPNVIKTPSPIAAEPPADEATELRGFRKSVAFYHSGATQAWPTRWYYAPNPDYTSVENYVADPVMEIAQTVTLPATLIVDYPFRKIYYDGDVVPASYTAMPPLPPEPYNSRENPDPDPLSAVQEPVLPSIRPLPIERPPLIFPPPETKPAEIKVKHAKTAPATGEKSPTTRPVR
ncbi:MAG TPA: hypothetical protein VFC46_04220 [Humisphaera sp.]|nr:hypothetical protein [Humisphaera sp.]